MNNNKSKYLFLGILIPLLLLFSSFNFISYNYTSLLWFESQEQAALWWKVWSRQVQFYLLGFGLACAGYYASYLVGGYRIRNRFGASIPGSLRLLFLGAPIFLALVVHGPSFASMWQEHVLASAPGTEFGVKDPLFNRDASFYMFQLDWYTGLLNWARTYLSLLAIYSAVLYLFPLQGLDFERDRRRFLDVFNLSLTHLGVIAGLFILMLAFDSWVTRYSLVFNGGSTRVAGASYTDVNARVPAYMVLFYLGLVLSVVVTASSFLRTWKAPVFTTGGWLAVYFIMIKVYPWAVQTITVDPNELTVEQPFIERSIKYTRIGYGLDKVKKTRFNAGNTVSAKALNRNPTIVKNIRLWDYRPIKATYRQLQEIKPYYEFRDVDIDRYMVNGELRQVLLSARELELSELPLRARSWIRSHLQYTHGYGVVMSPTNRITREGQPEFWIKDFPPKSRSGLPEVKQPGIYYGEGTNDYAVVKTSMKEIDYPRDQDFATTQYAGKGGVKLGSGLRKLLISWQFDTWKLLVSREVQTDSRVLFNRNIHRAVRRLAPFLKFDDDPYMVVGKDGKLYWMMDAYTTSTKFPYSRRFDRAIFNRLGAQRRFRRAANINYIRNSVKIVIDAYNGNASFYLFDEKDPVIRAWKTFLPGLFKPMKEMPEFLKPHLRYPVFQFMVQAGVYAKFHMEKAATFFNDEDLWEIATELYSGSAQQVEPYYLVTKLPGETKPEYILMLPFVPRGKDNLIAWMAARCDYGPGKDGGKYGQIMLLDFPRSRQFYGPQQIESRISQDADISKDLKLWKSASSTVIRGNLLVIPIEDSVLYVEPLYLRSQASSSTIPELKRVIVADAQSVVMRESLSGALSALTRQSVRVAPGLDPGRGGQPRGLNTVETARNARAALRRARRAAGDGRWEEFGKAMAELEKLLGQLSK